MNLALQRKRLAKARVALGDPGYRAALRLGVLPAVEHQAVLAQLPPLAAVLDVGANVGQFALVARHVFPAARITSFEPLPGAADKLRTVFGSDPLHTCVPVACSDAAGSTPFHVTGADDSSSLLRVADRQVAEFPATKGVATLTVTVQRLDDALPEGALPDGPALLKIDTQGSELAVLQGAAVVLARVSHVLVEASFVELYQGQASAADVNAHLVANGFGLRCAYDVKTSRITGEPIQADLLFER